MNNFLYSLFQLINIKNFFSYTVLKYFFSRFVPCIHIHHKRNEYLVVPFIAGILKYNKVWNASVSIRSTICISLRPSEGDQGLKTVPICMIICKWSGSRHIPVPIIRHTMTLPNPCLWRARSCHSIAVTFENRWNIMGSISSLIFNEGSLMFLKMRLYGCFSHLLDRN